MLKKLYFVLGVAGLLMVCGICIFAAAEIKNHDKEYFALFGRHMKVFSPEIPVSANFAGEAVPLEVIYVKEAFDREIMAGTFMQSSTIMMFKRACRWFPVIEPILKKNGIPDDFKFLVLAESNLVNVVSPAGAEGYWQFIKTSGVRYGLEINEFVDERYNMEKATQAACNYFRDAYKNLNNWTLVAASYNRGIDGIGKALVKQKVNNYFDLYLNDETSRYVFRIIALKEIYNHPVRYGFYLRVRDFYPQINCRMVVIDSSINNLLVFAKRLSVNYRILREFNPWIRNYSLPNKSRKIFVFQIPKEGALNAEQVLKKVLPSEVFFHDTLKINEVH